MSDTTADRDVQPQDLEDLRVEEARLQALVDQLEAKNRVLREQDAYLEIQALVPTPTPAHRQVQTGRQRSRITPRHP